MTEEQFEEYFGIKPVRAKQILQRFRQMVNEEVHAVIAHADFYIDPEPYCDRDYLEEQMGQPLEKADADDDGYTCLYEYGRGNGAVKTFMELISCHTRHGGHTSAIEACKLMDLEWEGDK